MINIVDNNKCCGCEACIQACPKHCISLKMDNEGFYYPNVDLVSCIECGLCEKICPELQCYNARYPLKVFAALNDNLKDRISSSSGGVFVLLAKKILDEGGVVFGAGFNDAWQVDINFTEDIIGLEQFKGSKYVQARIGNSYIDCKNFLEKGRKVLFSGTPCQIVGLHRFLRKQYSNLYTVDLICHGVPSPKVWQKYLCEILKKEGKSLSDIKNINIRNKQVGWREFGLQINLKNHASEKS